MTRLTRLISTRRARLAAALFLVVFLAVGGTASASAYWTATSSAVSATAKATTISDSMTDVSALNTTYQFAGATSPFIIKPITISNTGGAPLSYTLTDTTTGSSTLAGNVKVWVWLQTGGTCGTTTVGTAGTLTNLPALPSAASSAAAGASFVLCVATQLNTTTAASQGLSVTATFTLTGKVGTNWTATAGSSTTQSVFQIGNLTSLTCVNRAAGDGYGVTLTWPLVTGATGYALYVNGSTTPFTTYSATTVSARLNYEEDSSSQVIGNATTVRIAPVDATYGTTGTGLSQALHSVNVLFFFTTLQCGA